MKFKSFIVFLLLNFWPTICCFAVFSMFFLLALFLSVPIKDRLFNLIMFLVVFLIPAGLIYLCYYLCVKANSWAKKGVIVYSFWLILGFLNAYLVSAAIAGTSMAVAEGITGGWNLFLQEISFAGILLLFTQVLIIPWVVISVMIMKKKESFFFGS
ncbi:MAG: hypothetical protein PHP17_00910 [Candidatus Omnitrophica bacterium]|nr:hypothetical protein [Candidatus Omnitrophota bacterium]